MKRTILIPEPIAPAGRDYLTERGYALRDAASGEDLTRAVTGCAGIISRNVPLPAAVFDAADCLRVIGVHGVGYDHVDTAAARAHGVRMTWTPEANANAVAEHTLALLFAAARQVPRCDAAVRRGDFALRYTVAGMELAGRTLGILGFGRIGRLVAQKAALGLSMRVLVWDRHILQKELPDYVTPCGELAALLPQCDVLSIHLPLTPETAGLLDAAHLALLPAGAVLVNTARGAICDEDALCRALASGALAAAGIDVYAQEPPQDSPLCCLPNVVLTPHAAAQTQQARDAMSLGAAMGVHQVLTGQPVTWELPL